MCVVRKAVASLPDSASVLFGDVLVRQSKMWLLGEKHFAEAHVVRVLLPAKRHSRALLSLKYHCWVGTVLGNRGWKGSGSHGAAWCRWREFEGSTSWGPAHAESCGRLGPGLLPG